MGREDGEGIRFCSFLFLLKRERERETTYFLLGLAQKSSTSSFLFMSRSCSRSMPLNVNFLNVLLFGAASAILVAF